MSTTIATAAREYASRPADERFPSLPALISHAEDDHARSVERTYNCKDLHVADVSTAADPVDGSAIDSSRTIELQSPKGSARLTHWAFSQLARLVGAPAAYLRELPARITAEALNFGLSRTEHATDVRLLVKAPNGNPHPIVRSITSDAYGRVWDDQLYRAIQDRIVDHGSAAGGSWTLPPTWMGEPAGAYRGDRDSFLILTNGGSIVTDPSLSGSSDSAMYRGLLVRNSEVGASSVQIERILYRYVCGNHMLWGAVIDRSFRRRHVGEKTLRDTIREISSIAYDWATASASRDEAIIRGLIDSEIAHTEDAVIDELRKIGMPEKTARAAYARCVQTESVSPRSFWGSAQGLTRLSQESIYQDERYELDRLAMLVMARGAQKVRV